MSALRELLYRKASLVEGQITGKMSCFAKKYEQIKEQFRILSYYLQQVVKTHINLT